MRLASWYLLFVLMVLFFGMCSDVQAKDRETFKKIYREVVRAEEKYEIPRRVILSIMEIESDYRPTVVGKSHGEIGLLQLRPNMHKCASFDIAKNIQCGVSYLSSFVSRDESGTIVLETVVKYNVGPFRKGVNYKRTKYWRRFKDAYKHRRWRRWLDDRGI